MQSNEKSTNKFLPKQPITLSAYYIVQYWDNWGIENGEYKEATEREYAIHSGPYDSYLGAVLAIMEFSKTAVTAKFDILESSITGSVLGFDIDSGEI